MPCGASEASSDSDPDTCNRWVTARPEAPARPDQEQSVNHKWIKGSILQSAGIVVTQVEAINPSLLNHQPLSQPSTTPPPPRPLSVQERNCASRLPTRTLSPRTKRAGSVTGRKDSSLGERGTALGLPCAPDWGRLKTVTSGCLG